jgi:hypothetical protein
MRVSIDSYQNGLIFLLSKFSAKRKTLSGLHFQTNYHNTVVDPPVNCLVRIPQASKFRITLEILQSEYSD